MTRMFCSEQLWGKGVYFLHVKVEKLLYGHRLNFSFHYLSRQWRRDLLEPYFVESFLLPPTMRVRDLRHSLRAVQVLGGSLCLVVVCLVVAALRSPLSALRMAIWSSASPSNVSLPLRLSDLDVALCSCVPSIGCSLFLSVLIFCAAVCSCAFPSGCPLLFSWMYFHTGKRSSAYHIGRSLLLHRSTSRAP